MTSGRTAPPRAARTVNAVNLFLLSSAACLLAAARLGLQWYSIDGVDRSVNVAGGSFTFSDLHDNAAALGVTVSGWYFSWFGPAIAITAVAATLLANLPTPAADALRVLAFLASALGLVATYYALAQLFSAQRAAGGSAHTVWLNSSWGLWSTLAGFVLLAVAGARGPRRAG